MKIKVVDENNEGYEFEIKDSLYHLLKELPKNWTREDRYKYLRAVEANLDCFIPIVEK